MQNQFRLAPGKRKAHFDMLTDDEIAQLERAVAEAYRGEAAEWQPARRRGRFVNTIQANRLWVNVFREVEMFLARRRLLARIDECADYPNTRPSTCATKLAGPPWATTWRIRTFTAATSPIASAACSVA